MSASNKMGENHGNNSQLQQLSESGLDKAMPLPTQLQTNSPTTVDANIDNNNGMSADGAVAIPPVDAVTVEKISRPHMLQSFYIMFVTGMNDANFGIIIPSIREHYGISQAIVSLVFLCLTLGNFIAAFMNGYLIEKTSQAKTAIIGASALFIGFLICVFALPFPVMCCAQVVIGFGYALSEASANVVCGEMPRATLILNFLHAIYGAGALIAPQAAAALLNRNLSWTITYMYLAVLAFIDIGSTAYLYRDLKTRAERERQRHYDSDTTSSNDQQQQEYSKISTHQMIRNALTRQTTVMTALFLLLYVGIEVTLGSWGYTFLITVRSTDTVMMAQIMSGYWAGLCAGRLFLAYWTLKFGEKRMVYCYLVLTLGMLFIFWFVPAVAASAAALAILGIALGPLYPSAVSVANKTLPSRLYAVSIGFVAAFGSAGAAMFPYLTGVMIDTRGVGNTMAPFCIAMVAAMLCAWFLVPSPKKYKDDEASATVENFELSTTTITEDNTGNTRLRANNSSQTA